jgi:hypothetical protein
MINILEELQKGKKILWLADDIDTWSYNEDLSILEQWIESSLTGLTMVVEAISAESITVNWGDYIETYTSNDFSLV